IILLGAVAGGGDPAAITAALDQRIAAAVPLNFGGPQGYHPYPLPEDALYSFNYAGSGSWESTRNLRLSCRDGFLPWMIVGAIAPRRLVYAHEFSWDRERDPVWRRLQKIYAEFYEAPEHIDYSHGFGVVTKRPPEASHCNNIGPVQRERLHLAFNRWFGIDGSLATEYSNRRGPQELVSMTTAWERKLSPLKLHEKAERLASTRLAKAREDLRGMAPKARLQQMQQNWEALLGSVEPATETAVVSEGKSDEHGIEITRILIQRETPVPERRVLIPLVIMKMINSGNRVPVVIGVSQGGKGEFVQRRAQEVASLLSHGLAVCLTDLRGTGETAPDNGRGRTSRSTEISSSLLMLGETLVGQRLSDLRTVLNVLRSQPGIDSGRVIVWGDSLQQPNRPDTDLSVPMGIEREPLTSEPLGGMLGLLIALYEPDVRAIYVRGGLVSFSSVLSSPFCYLPHDMVIPGVIPAGDLTSLIEVLDPSRVRFEGLVDGLNQQVPGKSIRQLYPGVSTAKEGAGLEETTSWMLKRVR
ncbi:MAG: alpha/beta hydrolase family protein, partial [bacterium]